MTKYCLLILSFLWIIPNSLSSTEQTFPSIAVLAQTIIKSSWKTLEDHSDIKRDKTIEQKQSRMFQKIKHVTEVLRRLEELISAISYSVFYNITLLSAKTTIDETISYDFISFMQQIDIECDRLDTYSSQGKTVHSITMIDFAKTAVSHQSSSIKMLMEKIHEHIVPIHNWRSRGGILRLLTDNEVRI